MPGCGSIRRQFGGSFPTMVVLKVGPRPADPIKVFTPDLAFQLSSFHGSAFHTGLGSRAFRLQVASSVMICGLRNPQGSIHYTPDLCFQV